MTGASILVIDDEEEFVSTMVRRLRKRGWTSEGALTGTAALERIAADDFDVVLLDMRLPDMDGGQVFQEIRKIRPAIRVVILTGHASAGDGEEGIKNMAFDYLIKPVDFETLLKKLQAAREHGP